MIYIKLDTGFVEFNEDLDSNYKQGTTYGDYLQGETWVKLSDAQVTFKNENPTASIEEVWNMALNVPIRTLDEAKFEVINKIKEYDNSTEVNSFTLNGLSTWINVDDRIVYERTIAAGIKAGATTILFNNQSIDINTADSLMAQIEWYAGEASIVTSTHIANVQALTTVDEVDSYNYKTGYPDKKTFNL